MELAGTTKGWGSKAWAEEGSSGSLVVGSNLEVEIGSNLVEVLAGTEVAEETVMVL